jgi:AsmA family protein
MRRLVVIVLAVLALAVAAGAIAITSVDPNQHKAIVESLASDVLGQPVQIDGAITITRSLTPTLVANDVRVEGAGRNGTPISIGRAELSIVLLSLLSGPVHLPRVALDTVEVDLPLQPLQRDGSTVPRIDQLALSNVSVRYLEDRSGSLDALLKSATFVPTADRTATTLAIEGTLGGTPVEVSGTTGAIEALFAAAPDWPVNVEAKLGDGQLAATGSLGIADGDRQIAYRLNVKVDLPGSSKLLEVLQLPELPLEATTTLQDDAGAVRIEALSATIGKSDVSGDLRWQPARPDSLLIGKLSSKLVDLAELVPTTAEEAQGSDANLIPNFALLLPDQIALDMDINASIQRLDLAEGHLVDLVGQLTQRGHRLELNLTHSGLARGAVQGRYAVDQRGSADDVALTLNAQRLDLGVLFGDPDSKTKLPKDVTLKVDLSGAGADMRSFLGSANGSIELTTGPAVIDSTFANLLGKSLFTAIIPNFGESHGAHIICSVLDLTVTSGKARSTALVIDGKHVVVGGGGAIDLATEQIDVMLLPTAKDMTLAPLVAPVHLTGALTNPQVKGDATDILSTTGHLLLGIVDPLSLATPVLHPERKGDRPCLDPAAFAGPQQGPAERAGATAVDAIEGVGQGIGAAIKKVGEGASKLLEDVTGQ